MRQEAVPGPGDLLPRPCQPFLIRDDLVVRADLFPLPGRYNGRHEERHFELDNQIERFLTEKLAALDRAPDQYRLIDQDHPDELAEIYCRLLRLFSREYPEYVQFSGDTLDVHHLGLTFDLSDRLEIGITVKPDAPSIGRRVAAWIDRQSGIHRLGDTLALICQEDIVIMHLLPDNRHRAEALHVLLPSTWSPAEKYRQSFATIHEPVAESARLIASADNVMKAIVNRGPYVRFGLSLTTRPQLDSHPDFAKPWHPDWLANPDQLAANVTVRIERQTTCPFPDLQRALFSVRIYNTPLVDLASERPDLARRLATILRSASPAVLAYKGIDHYAAAVADWCDTGRECPPGPGLIMATARPSRSSDHPGSPNGRAGTAAPRPSDRRVAGRLTPDIARPWVPRIRQHDTRDLSERARVHLVDRLLSR